MLKYYYLVLIIGIVGDTPTIPPPSPHLFRPHHFKKEVKKNILRDGQHNVILLACTVLPMFFEHNSCNAEKVLLLMPLLIPIGYMLQ